MDPGVIAVFIPIVAIVMGIGIGMLGIWSEHKRKAQLLEQNHRERMQAIEKGIALPEITPGLVGYVGSSSSGPAPRNHWPRAMRNGLMLVLIGVVLYVAIDNVAGSEGSLFALLPAAIGVANLVYAAVLWKQEKDDPTRGS